MGYAFRLLLALVVVLHVAGAAWSQPLTGTLDEWDTSPLRPYDIQVLQDGSVWLNRFDMPGPVGDTLFTIDPTSGTTTAHVAPFSPARMQTLARGNDGTLWIADNLDRLVQFIPSTGTFVQHDLPLATFTLPAGPFGVSVAPDGMVWFTCWTDLCIGRFDPVSGIWARFAPLAGFTDPPVEIAFGPGGIVWFTIKEQPGPDPHPGLGCLDSLTGVFQLWTKSGSDVPYTGIRNPFGIALVGSMIWFLDHTANRLVCFNPSTEEFTPYATDLGGIIDPHYFVVDPGGYFWMTGFGNATLGRFNPSNGNFDVVTLETPGAHPMGISVAPTGEIWAAETRAQGTGGVARFRSQSATSIPTFSGAGVLLLVVLMGGIGGLLLRRTADRAHK